MAVKNDAGLALDTADCQRRNHWRSSAFLLIRLPPIRHIASFRCWIASSVYFHFHNTRCTAISSGGSSPPWRTARTDQRTLPGKFRVGYPKTTRCWSWHGGSTSRRELAARKSRLQLSLRTEWNPRLGVFFASFGVFRTSWCGGESDFYCGQQLRILSAEVVHWPVR